MPSVSKAQHGFFGAELRRKLKGEKGKTSMTIAQIKEFLHNKVKNLPKHVHHKK